MIVCVQCVCVCVCKRDWVMCANHFRIKANDVWMYQNIPHPTAPHRLTIHSCTQKIDYYKSHLSLSASVSAFFVLISLAFFVLFGWLNNCLLSGASTKVTARKIIPRLESMATKYLELRKNKPLTFIIIMSELNTTHTRTPQSTRKNVLPFCTGWTSNDNKTRERERENH